MKVLVNDPEGCFYNGDVATILHTHEIAGVRVHWVQVRGNIEFALREEKVLRPQETD